jgi:hypothetical protein
MIPLLKNEFALILHSLKAAANGVNAGSEPALQHGHREAERATTEAYRQAQINKRLPEDYEDLTDEEQQEIVADLEDLVASYDPAALRDEIIELGKLIQLGQALEKREVETKLVRLKELIKEYDVFKDPKMKLLIFTEHKDTLDFLCGDGKEGRPLGKLQEWGLTVTQIHGGMKIGDRDTPGSRIFAEREFRESAPGARGHRGRRRGHQPAILLADGQL